MSADEGARPSEPAVVDLMVGGNLTFQQGHGQHRFHYRRRALHTLHYALHDSGHTKFDTPFSQRSQPAPGRSLRDEPVDSTHSPARRDKPGRPLVTSR